MTDAIPRTHANLLAGIAPDAETGNLPGISRDNTQEKSEIADFMKMIERMGGTDASLSGIHLQAMAAGVEQFMIATAGADWREIGLPIHIAALHEVGEALVHTRNLWCWWARTQEPVDSGEVVIELFDTSLHLLAMILQQVPAGEMVASMHPDHVVTKLVNIFNATWNRHFDAMKDEGIPQSHEGAILVSYLDELTHCIISRNPVEAFGVLGAAMAILGMNPNVLCAGLMGKLHLARFRDENGYRTGEYRKVWSGGQEDNRFLLHLLTESSKSGFALMLGSYDDIKPLFEIAYSA